MLLVSGVSDRRATAPRPFFFFFPRSPKPVMASLLTALPLSCEGRRPRMPLWKAAGAGVYGAGEADFADAAAGVAETAVAVDVGRVSCVGVAIDAAAVRSCWRVVSGVPWCGCAKAASSEAKMSSFVMFFSCVCVEGSTALCRRGSSGSACVVVDAPGSVRSCGAE